MQNSQNSTLDARGLNCPLPIIRTRKTLDAMQAGERLELTASDPGSVKDIAIFCDQTGHALISSYQDVDDYVFVIEKY